MRGGSSFYLIRSARQENQENRSLCKELGVLVSIPRGFDSACIAFVPDILTPFDRVHLHQGSRLALCAPYIGLVQRGVTILNPLSESLSPG